jgi:4-amino-4-deoxy-L-arabinose transferase-like glycosyltransferase
VPLVLAAAALLLLARLGHIDFWAPDEPRYAQVAEELRSMQHGPTGLITLHLNGEVYNQKPPLYYWVAAAVGSPMGRVTEFSGRLPSALAGIGVVALTLAFGSRLLGPTAGTWGAALLLTALLFSHMARRMQLDVLLTLFETTALVAFWRLDRGIGRTRANQALLHGAMGLAVLTKGPVGLIVPMLSMAAYLVWERRPSDLRRALPPWALLLSLGPGSTWLAFAAWLAPPGFLSEAVGVNLLERFFAGTSHARPFYYYAYQFPADFLPWTLLWPLAAWFARRNVFAAGADPARARAWRLLLGWIAVNLVFFSLSSGKRGVYLIPMYPAVALVCADALVGTLAGRRGLPRWVGVVLGVFATALAAMGAALLVIGEIQSVVLPPEVGASLLAIAVVGFVAYRACASTHQGALARMAVAVVAVFAVQFTGYVVAYPALDPGKSPRPVASAAAAFAPPGRPIGLWKNRAFLGGLVYYGRRQVVQINTPEQLRAFAATHGGPIVVKERSLAEVEAVLPIEVKSRFREGRRALLVVVPTARDSRL